MGLKLTLKRSVSGFDIEEVDHGKLDGQPDIVDNVVLPANIAKRDGVDILVEPERDIDGKEHDGETLGADVEGQDLDAVANKQARPSRVVADIIDEYECDDSVTGGTCAGKGVLSKGDCRDNKDDQHACSGKQEKLATTDTLHEEAHENGNDQVDDLKDAVDQSLGEGVCNADLSKDDGKIV